MIGKTATSLLEQILVTDDGSSDPADGFDAASSVDVILIARQVAGYTTVEGDRQTQIPGNETVTVTVQHSDDGDSWDDVDAHEFDNDDLATITISSPKAFVRVSWALSGDNPQPILTATAIATGKTQDQIGTSPDGGSQTGAAIAKGFSFAFDKAGLAAGVNVIVPAVDSLLLNSWLEVDTAWDGTTPLGNVGTAVGTATGLFVDITAGAVDMTKADDESYGTGTKINRFWPSLNGDVASRAAPARFTATNPLKVWVSQDGNAGGADPGASQGAAVVWVVYCADPVITPL